MGIPLSWGEANAAEAVFEGADSPLRGAVRGLMVGCCGDLLDAELVPELEGCWPIEHDVVVGDQLAGDVVLADPSSQQEFCGFKVCLRAGEGKDRVRIKIADQKDVTVVPRGWWERTEEIDADSFEESGCFRDAERGGWPRVAFGQLAVAALHEPFHILFHALPTRELS